MVAALAAGSAGDTSAKLLSFTTISRGSSRPTVGADRNFGKTFVDIIGRVTDPGGWTTFVPKNRRNEDRRRQLPNSFCDRRSRPGAKYWISGHDQTHHALAWSRVQGVREGRYVELTVRLSSRPFRVDQFHWSIPTTWLYGSRVARY